MIKLVLAFMFFQASFVPNAPRWLMSDPEPNRPSHYSMVRWDPPNQTLIYGGPSIDIFQCHVYLTRNGDLGTQLIEEKLQLSPTQGLHSETLSSEETSFRKSADGWRIEKRGPAKDPIFRTVAQIPADDGFRQRCAPLLTGLPPEIAEKFRAFYTK